MKNIQLRRGNKVLHNGVEKTIDCISPGYVILLEDRPNDEDFGKWIDLDEIEFIPISEERLIILGFNKIKQQNPNLLDSDYPHYFRINEGRTKEITIENLNSSNCFVFGFGRCSNIKLNYVHEIQNLYFALTNEKL